MSASTTPLLPCLAHYPGGVLRLSPDGTVLESNGRLDEALGRPLAGRPLAPVLDAGSSRAKWGRLLAAPADELRGAPWELVFQDGSPASLGEPRTFSASRDEATGELWLLEHPRDARLDALRRDVVEVNSDLAAAQRELVREKGKLARALTRLEAQQRELERSNQDLDQFAHVVSHDLKAPLRAIGTYARFLREDLAPSLSGEQREYLDRLENRAAYVQAMIQGILTYARVDRHHAPPEEVEVAQLARETVELLDPPPGVEVRLAPDLPRLRTRRAPLQQVLLNLMGNAVRHAAGPRPLVRLGWHDRGEFVEFQVEDNGPGIPDGAQDRIWALFHTLEGGGSESTGIGLAVVKKLVEAQGGRAWVDSRPGAGATFRFLWRTRPSEGG